MTYLTAKYIIEAAAKDLGGDQPLVALDGWNVTTQPRQFSRGGRSSITVNADAQIGSAR